MEIINDMVHCMCVHSHIGCSYHILLFNINMMFLNEGHIIFLIFSSSKEFCFSSDYVEDKGI